MPLALQTWPTSDVYYEQVPAARRSRELDLGVWWAFDADMRRPRWRVTYVVDPGHVVAVRTDTGGTALLAEVARPDWMGPHDYVDKHLLPGWAEHCGQPHSLWWVVERLRHLHQQTDRIGSTYMVRRCTYETPGETAWPPAASN